MVKDWNRMYKKSEPVAVGYTTKCIRSAVVVQIVLVAVVYIESSIILTS